MFPPAHIVDRCWGIPVVATFSAFFVFLAPSCAGLLYVLFMEKFGVSHEMAAWPQSTYMVMSNTIGLVLSVLQQRVPLYHLTMFGVALTCTGLIAAAFSPDIKWMAVLYGGIYGAGAGISMISLSLYLLVYFDKYRATATAFKYAGWAASGIIGPTFLGYIAENYGPQGALLLVGAMALQAVPLVMLLGDPQPLSMPAWCTRASTNTTTRTVTQNDIQYLTGSAEITPKRPLLLGKVNRRYNTNEETDNYSVAKKKPIKKVTKNQSSLNMPANVVTKLDGTNLCRANSALLDNNQKKRPLSAKQMKVDSSSLLGHYGALLRNPLFYVLLIAFMTIDYMMTMVDTTIVEYGIDKGVATLKDANKLQTFTATGQLIGRIVVPFISDKVANSRCPFTAASLALAAACLLLISRVNPFGLLSALTALLGVCEGYLLCIKGVLIGDYLGVQTLAAVLGLLGVASIPALLSAPSFIGFFRDKLGSYDKFYWLLAAVSFMAACLMSCIVATDQMHRKRWNIDYPNKRTCGEIVGTAYGTDVPSLKEHSPPPSQAP